MSADAAGDPSRVADGDDVSAAHGWCTYCHAIIDVDAVGAAVSHPLDGEQCPGAGRPSYGTVPGGVPPSQRESPLWDATYAVVAIIPRPDADVRRELARGLRTARESLGLTMGDVADALSLPVAAVTVTQVSAWERGEAMDARQLRAYLYACATTQSPAARHAPTAPYVPPPMMEVLCDVCRRWALVYGEGVETTVDVHYFPGGKHCGRFCVLASAAERATLRERAVVRALSVDG